ncbi:d07c2339-c337-4f15-8be8-b123dfe57de3 [Sclerotinia trifoliorum]|uniref:D07c2339-c337-4f15-8be8-b123dfe57de3 n=1 Tax=Sclerotinia trifoliorum TaxID=28548 RepID=A0A8H2VRR2_9HELO|nr:d07c2339-c337-4f15-8be8-b123dfe57de3 [Sclerotinia trifoliorum]
MEGRNQNKGAMTSPFGPNPDDPLLSIEGSDTGLSDDASTPVPPTRDRSQQRGGLIGSLHHRTSSTTPIPPQLAREQRGSGSGHSASLSLGSLNPLGQQQLSSDPVPGRTSHQSQMSMSYHQPVSSYNSQSSSRATLNGLPMSNIIKTNTIGSSPTSATRFYSRQQSSPHQLARRTMTSRGRPESHFSPINLQNEQPEGFSHQAHALNSNHEQVPAGNFKYLGPINYNPLADALNPNDTSNYPTQLPPNLRQRAQMQLGLSASRGMVLPAESHAPKGTATGSSNTSQSTFGVLVPPRKKRGRPLGSKTKIPNGRRTQHPRQRTILPRSSVKSSLPSSAAPVSFSQQLNVLRASRGVTFSLAKNASAMLNPFSEVVPATVKLVADDGQLWVYKYAGTRRGSKSELSGNVTVAQLNEWANSILRRRLPDNFPATPSEESSSTPPKPKADKWTEWERKYLEAHIMDALKAKKTNLDEEDWQLIAEAQNEEFLHYKRLPGLPLAHLTSRTLTIDNVPLIRGGGFTKTEGYFPKRSSSEIQSILYRWPDVQEKIKEEIKKHHGKTPEYLDYGTDLSDSERTSDDENGENDTIIVDTGASELPKCLVQLVLFLLLTTPNLLKLGIPFDLLQSAAKISNNCQKPSLSSRTVDCQITSSQNISSFPEIAQEMDLPNPSASRTKNAGKRGKKHDWTLMQKQDHTEALIGDPQPNKMRIGLVHLREPGLSREIFYNRGFGSGEPFDWNDPSDLFLLNSWRQDKIRKYTTRNEGPVERTEVVKDQVVKNRFVQGAAIPSVIGESGDSSREIVSMVNRGKDIGKFRVQKHRSSRRVPPRLLNGRRQHPSTLQRTIECLDVDLDSIASLTEEQKQHRQKIQFRDWTMIYHFIEMAFDYPSREIGVNYNL